MWSLLRTGFTNHQFKYKCRTFHFVRKDHETACLCRKHNLIIYERPYTYTVMSKFGKLINLHVEKMKQCLDIDHNLKPIITTIEDQSYSGFVRKRYRSTLSISVPLVTRFRTSGLGSTRDLAERSAVSSFIKALQEFYLKHEKDENYNCSVKNEVEDDREAPVFGTSYYHEQNTNLLNARKPFFHSIKRPYTSQAAESGVRRIRSPAEPTQEDDDVHQQFLYTEILKAYPAPKNRLHNFYEHLRRSTGEETAPLLHFSSKRHNMSEWIFTVKVDWPEPAEFNGIATRKGEASKKASIKALKWLKDMGKIDLKGNLRLIDEKSHIQQETRKPLAEVTVNKEYVNHTEILVDQFVREFADQLHDASLLCDNRNVPNYANVEQEFHETFETPSADLLGRNQQLFDVLQRRKQMNVSRTTLPIAQYKDEILELVRNNSVVVIKGEPGCGKSTQVPQYIFDEWTDQMKGTECNIVCTQPRRISAITLAERIAFERNEQIGNVIGYQVRFANKAPAYKNGNIIFCTLGIMLRKLLSRDGMKGITHLLIDEAHERDLNTDFLLLLAKRAVTNNPNFRIVIMSATINAELFQAYYNNAPSIHIPGFTYPVTSTFLDANMAQTIGLPIDKSKNPNDLPDIDPLAVAKMVMWVDQNRPPGAILVFLPGWDTIRKVREELETQNGLYVVPIHSRLTHFDQRKIFSRPPLGKRKVVLATNIAETSITIDDIEYVIDSGALKEKRLHSQDGISCLDNHWASQASVRQRKGRAGRVKPGECYHLYAQEKYDSFDVFPLPEVHRIRLEMSVLQSKIYSGHEKAEQFLSQLPEPPSIIVIREAVQKLRFIGALDESENLTPLGRRISVFTTHPLISKGLVHSYIFKCVNPLVTIGTILSSDIELFPGMLANKYQIRNGKKKFSPSSDHLALAWLYQQWADYSNDDVYKAKQLMDEVLGSHDAFGFIKRLRELVGNHLSQCKLVDRLDDALDAHSDSNTYSGNDELIKGVLLSGLGNLLIVRNWELRKGVVRKTTSLVSEIGYRAILGSESVNYRRVDFPTPLITYFQEVHSLQTRMATIRETSIVSPLTVILFQPGTLTLIKPFGAAAQGMEGKVVLQLQSKRYLKFVCDERTGTALVKLREALWAVVDFLVREEGNPQNIELYQNVTNFHDKTLVLLNKMLLEAGTEIDYDANGKLRSNFEPERQY